MADVTWTAEDVAALRAAVIKLATGQRVVSVSYAGPPARTQSYGIVQLGELRALLASAEQAVRGTGSFRLATVNKGLGR